MTIQIDAEFKALIPPLSAEEYAQLEANILADGCRDALVVWNDTLIDGHNRHSICEKHGVTYQTISREFDSREDVIIWMIRNQFARRNITDFVRGELADRMSDIFAAKAKENQSHGKTAPGKNAFVEFNKSVEPINTRAEVAKLADTSQDTIRKVRRVSSKAPKAIKEAARKGHISVNRAYKVTVALENASPEVVEIVSKGGVDDPDVVAELVRLQIEAPTTFEDIQLSGYIQSSESAWHVADGYKAMKAVLKALAKDHAVTAQQTRKQNSIDKALEPDAKYRVIYADPPWKYDNTMPDYFTEQADHYDLMTLDEIAAMPIIDITEDNAVLFLWVTSPVLEQSFDIIHSWGFKYKASFVWDKVKHNMGHYNSVRHEFLLVCVRGSCQPDVIKLFDSVVTVERSDRHSEKPEDFRQIIDTIYPYGKRIELFARVRAEGWDAYGNQVPDATVPGCEIKNAA